MPGPSVIGPAKPEDTADIHALLVEAFGASSLKFSVYQSRTSIAYLAEEISKAEATVCPCFFVLRRGGAVEGFYNAFTRKGELFLNHIATGAAARGLGVGRLLLSHFEATGVSTGCLTLGLEVFRSNSLAVEWYARHGYLQCGSRFRARFELAAFAGAGRFGLELDPGLLARALEEEAVRGFSRVDCSWSGKPARLGFIGGEVCNLLSPQGLAALAVAPALARRFGASRRWLLVSGAESFADATPPESQEEALYMMKALAGRDPGTR